MAIQSILPSPVGAELSGAGSFFGSCQVDANTFIAALTQAQGVRAEGPTPQTEAPMTPQEGSLQPHLQGAENEIAPLGFEWGTNQGPDRLTSLIQAVLGPEAAEEYAQLAPMLDTASLEAQLPEGEVSLEALNLVLQQLVVQLEQLMTQITDPEQPLIEGLEWAPKGESSPLMAKIQNLIPVVNEWMATSTLNVPSTAELVVDHALESVKPEEVSKAIPVEPPSPPKEGKLSEKEVQAQTLAQMLAKTSPTESVRSVEAEGESDSEPEGETSKRFSEPSAKPALNAPSPTTETVVRFDGGELKLQTVDARTGTPLQSAPLVDQQQRIQDLEVVRQVADKVRFVASQGTQQMTLHLSPEHLGSVHLKVALKAGEMQIHAVVETEMAQRALESNISSLRESLEKQGISLDGLEVSVERQKNEASSFADSRQNGQGRSRGKRQPLGPEGRLVQTNRKEGAETGRRLGYNTMEYLA